MTVPTGDYLESIPRPSSRATGPAVPTPFRCAATLYPILPTSSHRPGRFETLRAAATKSRHALRLDRYYLQEVVKTRILNFTTWVESSKRVSGSQGTHGMHLRLLVGAARGRRDTEYKM